MDYMAEADLVLLLLIGEEPGINGYGIGRRVEQRGLAAWAGVASSSIYNGLKRVEANGWATSSPDLAKRDRGPRGQAYRLTASGRSALTEALTDALATTREHDPRFNIALSGVGQLDAHAAADALAARATFLAGERERLVGVRDAQPDRSASADLLFDRILHALDAERAWTAQAATTLRPAAPPGVTPCP